MLSVSRTKRRRGNHILLTLLLSLCGQNECKTCEKIASLVLGPGLRLGQEALLLSATHYAKVEVVTYSTVARVFGLTRPNRFVANNGEDGRRRGKFLL